MAWGLQFEAIPAPQAPGERPAHIGLTWQMLNETIEGLFACVVARKEYFVLRAIITSEVGVTLDHMGDLTLGYAKRPVDTA